MNTISLTKTHTTAAGSVHAQIKINNNDVGLLYLTPQEIDILTSALRDGLLNSGTTLETDLFDEEYSDDELY
jgi:hypothetical protein